MLIIIKKRISTYFVFPQFQFFKTFHEQITHICKNPSQTQLNSLVLTNPFSVSNPSQTQQHHQLQYYHHHHHHHHPHITTTTIHPNPSLVPLIHGCAKICTNTSDTRPIIKSSFSHFIILAKLIPKIPRKKILNFPNCFLKSLNRPPPPPPPPVLLRLPTTVQTMGKCGSLSNGDHPFSFSKNPLLHLEPPTTDPIHQPQIDTLFFLSRQVMVIGGLSRELVQGFDGGGCF